MKWQAWCGRLLLCAQIESDMGLAFNLMLYKENHMHFMATSSLCSVEWIEKSTFSSRSYFYWLIFRGACVYYRNSYFGGPGRKTEEVLFVSADENLTKKDVHYFGLRMNKFKMELHHVKEYLKDELGPPCYSKMSSCIHTIINTDD